MEKLLHFISRTFLQANRIKCNIYFFRAQWCESCRISTSKLAETFNEIRDELKDKFDIVFISWDKDQSSFDEYFKEMPWKALPFSGL